MCNHPVHFIGVGGNAGQVDGTIHDINAEIQRGNFAIADQFGA